MRVLAVGAVALAVAVGGAVIALRPSGPQLEVVTAGARPEEGPGLCPWREPEADMKRFFPGATGYHTLLLPLSRKRSAILKRLGPGYAIQSNALYLYEVERGGTHAGTVVVQRAAGRYGAIEVVAALDHHRRIAGIRIQRQREPEPTASLLTSSRWLAGFRGKDASSAFRIGRDLPPVPAESAESASAVAATVREVLVELDEGGAPVEVHDH